MGILCPLLLGFSLLFTFCWSFFGAFVAKEKDLSSYRDGKRLGRTRPYPGLLYGIKRCFSKQRSVTKRMHL